MTRGAVLGLDGQIGQTPRKSDRSFSSGGGGTVHMQNTETRFDSTHLQLLCSFCCTSSRLYERSFPFLFLFYSVLPCLFFIFLNLLSRARALSLSLSRFFLYCIFNSWPILCSASLAPLSHRPDSSKGRISATYKTRRL
ncbi:hypothetical protein GGI43DRAFT_116079 [Trichoderma evansii]